MKDIEEIALVMYKDVYSKEGYILEVYSNKATKAVIGNHNEESIAKRIQSHYEMMKKEKNE